MRCGDGLCKCIYLFLKGTDKSRTTPLTIGLPVFGGQFFPSLRLNSTSKASAKQKPSKASTVICAWLWMNWGIKWYVICITSQIVKLIHSLFVAIYQSLSSHLIVSICLPVLWWVSPTKSKWKAVKWKFISFSPPLPSLHSLAYILSGL